MACRKLRRLGFLGSSDATAGRDAALIGDLHRRLEQRQLFKRGSFDGCHALKDGALAPLELLKFGWLVRADGLAIVDDVGQLDELGAQGGTPKQPSSEELLYGSLAVFGIG